MTLTGEIVTLYLAIMLPILGGVCVLWAKLDAIWRAIGQTVTHETCEKRRDKCPCVKDIAEMREEFKIWKNVKRGIDK